MRDGALIIGTSVVILALFLSARPDDDRLGRLDRLAVYGLAAAAIALLFLTLRESPL